MLVSTYDSFVQRTDQTVGKPIAERRDIALYGLAAEIGSVVAAVKKRLLASDADKAWNVANDEIVKELGDVVWYCFSLARIANPSKPVNIFAHDVANLKQEIGADDARAERLRRELDPTKRTEFLKAAASFPKLTRNMCFEDYQAIAYLTARTRGRTLAEVCLAVLWQLGAQLLRCKLPDSEIELNDAVTDRLTNDLLGGVAWHVSALASLYGLSLGDIARENMEKVGQRYDRGEPTPLHDIGFPSTEQLPRRFKVGVVTVGRGRSRMYLEGRRLGDELTDNAYADDGYRFHDVMHLANAAKLGWSPVLRSLLGRKRKSDPKVDEVEDGARARIVEEAVIKAIHSEGLRLAGLRVPGSTEAEQRLFLNASEISNHFLDFIRSCATDLEVNKNRSWEWEAAIVEGYRIFHSLRQEGQGTITVDLDARTIEFRPEVEIPLSGRVAGLGSAHGVLEVSDEGTPPLGQDPARERVMKRAILSALGGLDTDAGNLPDLSVTELGGGLVSVKASGAVEEAMWDRRVVAVRTTMTEEAGRLHCTALAMSDD
jgi:NTP pyrophosphatase (non-canonical NTP hydrolase)